MKENMKYDKKRSVCSYPQNICHRIYKYCGFASLYAELNMGLAHYNPKSWVTRRFNESEKMDVEVARVRHMQMRGTFDESMAIECYRNCGFISI